MSHTERFLSGLLVGTIAGGIVALLYAPQSGKETRKNIKDKSLMALDSLSKRVDEIESIIEKFKKRAPVPPPVDEQNNEFLL